MNAARILASLFVLMPSLLTASPKQTLDLLFATHGFKGVALSPDAARVAWVEDRPNADRTPSDNSALFVRETRGGRTTRVTAGVGRNLSCELDPAWSPDSRRLAFLSDAAKRGQRQIYLADADGGAPRRLTSLIGYLAHLKWSPDGKTIAVLNIADSLTPVGAVEASKPRTGEIEEHASEARLVLIDVSSGTTRALSPADSYVYEFDWAPDSRQVAVISARGDGDNNWWTARLQVIDCASAEVRELFRPSTQIAVPRWSPDGSQIALIQGLMSDAGSTGGDIWLVPVTGGLARNLTAGRRGSPAWVHWLPGAGRLLFSESVDGASALCELDTSSGQAKTLWQGDERFDRGGGGEMLSVSVADNGETTALVRSSFSAPPALWVGPIGKWQLFKEPNRDLKPAWGRVEKLSWTSDAYMVQGWLLYPANFDPARRYPLVVSIHGGPASMAASIWPATGSFPAVLSAEGYFVLIANPRGSYGQGEAFTTANKRDFGGGDLRDILAGLDRVLKTAPVDPHRLGVTGWSYGGYMTMWAVTQTDRFRAAVSGAGVANMLSYYGENQIDAWMIPYFGASAYDDPAAYAQCSPITFIRNAHTPTLILVGDSDKECPAPQSFEFWHALKTLGVDTRLVVYDHEGHHFRKPADAEDLVNRTVDWFNARLR